ncbi:MAG: hypothetical protein KC800_04475 [Candidatus Eremiobacteraeota bacterium]|nr:hypothetical protein [Candidatus Eremiobacteraeota bacterium]
MTGVPFLRGADFFFAVFFAFVAFFLVATVDFLAVVFLAFAVVFVAFLVAFFVVLAFAFFALAFLGGTVAYLLPWTLAPPRARFNEKIKANFLESCKKREKLGQFSREMG